MSNTEIRMTCYTIEQLSAELQAIRQYVSDIKSKLDRTRKALDVAVDALKIAKDCCSDYSIECLAHKTLEQITAVEQKE